MPLSVSICISRIHCESIFDSKLFQYQHRIGKHAPITINRRISHIVNNPFFWIFSVSDNKSQETVQGTVTVQLFKGSAYPVARTSPLSLYDPELSSMDVAGGYDQQDAGGFIRINAIRLKAYTAVKNKLAKISGGKAKHDKAA